MIDNQDMPWPMRQLIYAFDYDDTFTADPATHRDTINLWQKSCHRVICISARHDTFENRQELTAALPPGVEVYLCDHMPKELYAQRHGLSVDIWLDDNPDAIVDWDEGKPKRGAGRSTPPVDSSIVKQLRSWIGGPLQQPNWDSDGAARLTTRTIEAAITVAEALNGKEIAGEQIVMGRPLVNGGIQLCSRYGAATITIDPIEDETA